ncbi:putative acid phosphatase, precursor [Suhomyces tanzawaensis NRRL Y-17324]|uniref:Putative acid phosphatase n=1 Tax=Suhomyces tanzawaensis NRRL Y-17324 TaxID=984487 RepID=A0A1E4SDC8_9ASCO|nr:putative acid phosphatase, precursor [Suhomyces tanzawaensis NRRL Y-17324]ODV77519.1 putative acid phosphatase, precursor [Suhomyces tanzawaensis NRRL Y-17324]
MQFPAIFYFLLATVVAKNILLTNDDSWISTNIRATYYKLKEAGHTVYLVAPANQRSGFGGRFEVPTSNKLTVDGEFGYVKAGDPAWGHEPNDDHIWYFGGSPASSVAFALKYVLPVHFKTNDTIDLVVAGPNEGTNLSPGLFTISGTIGGTVAAVYRGLPAVGFSGSNGNNTLYSDFLDLSDELEPSTIYANKVVEFVDELFKAQGNNDRALPLGVGLNVNMPDVGYRNESCTNPKWTSTRLTGHNAYAPDLLYDADKQIFSYHTSTLDALTVCANGDCTLPSETDIVEHTKCQSSVSVFNIDYDANAALTEQTNELLKPLFA